MATAAPAAQSGGSDLLQSLISRIGLSGALQLLSLLSPNASGVQRGFGAAQLASQGASALGFNPQIGGYGVLPGILGAAGLSYNIDQIATNPNLSTGQKAGNSALAATDLGQLLIPGYGQFYGLGLAANAIGQQMEKSGSPQIRAGGRQILAPLLPVEGLRQVLSGNESPRAAFNQMIGSINQVPVLGHATGEILKAFGLGTPPTTGTEVRHEVGAVANQIPALRGFQMGQDVLNADEYNQYTPEAQKNAYALADLLGSYAPDYKKNQPAYQVQLGNSLLKQYGNDIPGIVKSIFNPTPTTPETPAAAPSVPPTNAAPSWLQDPGVQSRIANYLAGQAR